MPSSIIRANTGRGKPQFSSATINIVWDGNSIDSGVGYSDTQYPSTLLTASDVLSGSGITVNGIAIGGQSWANMRDNHADLDALLQPGKRNILVFSETTNSINNENKNTTQTISDMRGFVSVASAWERHMILTMPRRQSPIGNITQTNLDLVTVDNYVRANWHEIGLSGYIDLRLPGSIWNLADYSDASFSTLDAWTTAAELFSGSGQYIHPNQAGHQLRNQHVQQHLRRIGAYNRVAI